METGKESPKMRDALEGIGGVDAPPRGGSAAGGSARETAHQAKDAAVDTAEQIAGQAQEQAGQVVDQAKQQAGQVVDQAKQQATSAFVDQKDRAVTGLTGLADALRQTGRSLRESGDQPGQTASGASQAQASAGIGQFVEEAADRLSQSADFLKDKEFSEILQEAQQFARKQPLAFVGAMFGAGLIAARLLKSGMPDGGSGASLLDQAKNAADAATSKVSEMAGGSDESDKPDTSDAPAGYASQMGREART